jgi:hypothetical protein
MKLHFQMKLLVLTIFLIFVAEFFLTMHASRAADDCVSEPNTTPPQGTHWYYRVDRTTHRQCWYLGAEGAKVRPHQQQSTSTLRSPTSSKAARPEPRTTIIAAAAPANITVIDVPAKTDSTMEASFDDTSDLSKPDGALIDGSLISTKPADEYSATKILGDTLIARPIVSATEAATAGQPTGFAITYVHLLAVLAVVLALIAIIARTIFRLRRICQPDGTKLRGLGSKPPRVEKRRTPKFNNAAAATRQADVGRAVKPAIPRSSAAFAEIEPSVRRLLHELHKRQHRFSRTGLRADVR